MFHRSSFIGMGELLMNVLREISRGIYKIKSYIKKFLMRRFCFQGVGVVESYTHVRRK